MLDGRLDPEFLQNLPCLRRIEYAVELARLICIEADGRKLLGMLLEEFPRTPRRHLPRMFCSASFIFRSSTSCEMADS